MRNRFRAFGRSVRGVKEPVSFTQMKISFFVCGKHQIGSAEDVNAPQKQAAFIFSAVGLPPISSPLSIEFAIKRIKIDREGMMRPMAARMGLMAQYLPIKEQYKDAVLMFQVGGFYQLYYHDAELAKQELGMTMVSRAVGGGMYAPMCGFPKAGGEKYAERLVQKGYRVVFCNQSEEKDENGMAQRTVAKVVEPDKEPVDLSAAWDEYLETHPLDSIQPPQRPKKHRKVESSLLDQLASLDLETMAPIAAWRLLQSWKEMYVPSDKGTDGLRKDM